MKSPVSPFYEMQVLVAVVECGSFTAAARRLDLPKSSVSRRLTSLEERLGIRLLQRTTRSLRLTTAGEAYFASASRLLQELDELETRVSGFSEQPHGRLRITCPSGFAAANADLFADFGRRYPGVRMALEETDRLVDLVAEGFDLAFRGGRPPDGSLAGFRLLASERVLAASPAYLERRGEPTRLKDLPEHDLLSLGAHHQHLWRLHNGRKEVEVDGTSCFVTNNLRTLQRAAEQGMGIALLPRVNCEPAFGQGSLRHLLPEWSASAATLWLVYPDARGMASSVRAFLDLVKEWPLLRL